MVIRGVGSTFALVRQNRIYTTAGIVYRGAMCFCRGFEAAKYPCEVRKHFCA